jgi:hypothetical protein
LEEAKEVGEENGIKVARWEGGITRSLATLVGTASEGTDLE